MLALSRSVLPLFALALFAIPANGHAETKMVGHLEAATPCTLQALPKEPKECLAMTVPIGGTVTITSDSGTRKRVRVNAKGIFATRLTPGEYVIKLTQASISGNPIDADDLRLSERHLTVGERSFRVRYEVAHKDHFPHVLAGPVM